MLVGAVLALRKTRLERQIRLLYFSLFCRICTVRHSLFTIPLYVIGRRLTERGSSWIS